MLIKFDETNETRLKTMLKEYIQKRYDTQTAFAAEIGTSCQRLTNILNGSMSIPCNMLKYLVNDKEYEKETWEIFYKTLKMENSTFERKHDGTR